MEHHELVILNSLVTYAAENIPGGLSSQEHEVAFKVALWAMDGVPVCSICPHCGTPAPHSPEGRQEWLEDHVDSILHRWWWGLKNHRLLKV